MRHIKTYDIFEKKMVGVIYHFTEPKNLVGILEEDRMHSGHKHISFTRNPDLKAWYQDYRAYCRIAFNGSDMSNKFRIEPYLFDPGKDPLFGGGPKTSYVNRKKWYGEEREERIPGEEITGITKYIIQIDYLLEYAPADFVELQEAEALAKKLGIPINVVEEFKPVRGQII